MDALAGLGKAACGSAGAGLRASAPAEGVGPVAADVSSVRAKARRGPGCAGGGGVCADTAKPKNAAEVTTSKRVQEKYGDYKLVIHDLAAMAVAVKPEIAEIVFRPVDVETAPGPMEARTIVDLRPYSPFPNNVHVAEKIDIEGYKDLIKESVEYFRRKDKQA